MHDKTTEPATGGDAERKLAAVRTLLLEGVCQGHGLAEVSEHMTCTEADAMAGVLRMLDAHQEAAELIACHARSDEFEDAHWQPVEGQCMDCAAPPGASHDVWRCMPDPELDPDGLARATVDQALEPDHEATPSLQAVADALEALTATSQRHDVESYRRALRMAQEARLTGEQIEDAWRWAWNGRSRTAGRPPFDWQGTTDPR